MNIRYITVICCALLCHLGVAKAQSTAVEPMLKTTWGQGAPYNELCPTVGNSAEHYVTGCVATAMAQIMNYHQHPVQGNDYQSYRFVPQQGESVRLSANFGETTYLWNDMLDSYSEDGYTTAQAQAVATLMLHCGVAMQMQYSPSGSGAFTYEAAVAMHHFFCYNENIQFLNRDYFTDSEWLQLLHKELEAGRPVLYSAASGGYGHAFVIDGINEQGQVHVNWGWNGDANGYYDLNEMNPRSYMFTEQQGMLTGICRPDVPIEWHSLWGLDGSLRITRTQNDAISLSVGAVYNIAAREFSGTVALVAMAEQPEGRQAVSVLAYEPQAERQYGEGFVPQMTNISIAQLPHGRYHLCLASRQKGESEWQPVRAKQSQVSSYALTIGDRLGVDGHRITHESLVAICPIGRHCRPVG